MSEFTLPMRPVDIVQRFDCDVCRDQGLVTVWSADAMRAAAAGSLPSKYHTTSQVMVARRLGLHAVGIELNPEYAAMSRKRIRDDQPLLNAV